MSTIFEEMELMLNPDLYADPKTYLRWLKSHERGTFTGQDVLRIFINNLDAGEKQYVIAFFKEFYNARILTDVWNLNYDYEYQSSFFELIFSTWGLISDLFWDVLGFYLYSEPDIYYHIVGYLLEAYRLFSAWIAYYDSVQTEVQKYDPTEEEAIDPPWWLPPEDPPWWRY